jgi:nucleoside-diphosphate-sugar epimerase
MRVLVTGGTGFVGSHTAAALRSAGHDLRLLVRSRERVAAALEPLGLTGGYEVVEGDVTDETAVARALEDCEAVLHGASVFSFDPRASAGVRATNVPGTERVLGAARRLGLDPIVQLSSLVALLPAAHRPLTPDGPLGHPPTPYLRSKAEQEAIARRLQEEGAPVVIVQPGWAWGPNDPKLGESDQTARAILGGRQPIISSGGISIVDVRDVAAALAAVFRPRLGPRRYLLGGHYVTFPELLGLFRELSGRRLPALTLPETLILPVARAADLVQRLLPFRIPIPTGGIWLTKQRARSDDSRAEAELGFAARDLRETLADTIRSLLETGRLTPKQAGKLGSA